MVRPETSVTVNGGDRTAARRPPTSIGVVVLIVVALVIVGKVTTPQFVTGDNLLTILRAASLTAIAPGDDVRHAVR